MVQSYYKTKLEELLDNHLLAINLLTISANKLSKKILKLKEHNQNKDYIIKVITRYIITE